jgi:hypothetical protein
MTIDIDGPTRFDLTKAQELLAQPGLKIKAVLHADILKETVLSRYGGEKGKACKKAEVGAVYGINGSDARGKAEDRFKDDAQGKSFVVNAVMLGSRQGGSEIMGFELKQVRNEKETSRAGGCQPSLEHGADLVFDVVARDDEFARFTGAVENLDFFLGQKAWRKGLRSQRFFLDKP